METTKVKINIFQDNSRITQNSSSLYFSTPIKLEEFISNPKQRPKLIVQFQSQSSKQNNQKEMQNQLQIQSQIAQQQQNVNKRYKLPIGMKNFLRQNRIISLKAMPTTNPIRIKRNQLKNKQSKKPFMENQSFQELEKHQNHNQQLQNVEITQNQHKIDQNNKSIKQNKQNNNNVIKIQQTQIFDNKTQQTQQNVFICSICQTCIESNKSCKIFDCQHQFCYECLQQYVKYKIKMFQQVYCPNQMCENTLIKQSNFFDQLTLKQRKNYMKINKFYTIYSKKSDNKQQIRLCPLQICEGVIKIIQQNNTQKCSSCLQNFCSLCFKIQHQGPCDTYDVDYMKQTLKLIQCTKCHSFIQKKQGCFHITCKCGYQFCQKCNQLWSKGHICKFSIINQIQTNGCDWGLNTKDHCIFILKLPFKIILCLLLALFWITFSIIFIPLNIFIFIYWLYLIFILPNYQQFAQNNQISIIEISIRIIFFPFVILKNIPKGFKKVIDFIDKFVPQFKQSFIVIIRI